MRKKTVKTINREEDKEQLQCSMCNNIFTDDDDKLLQCERCSELYCSECLEYNDTEYQMLSKRPEIPWYSATCQQPAVQAIQTEWDIEERCNEYLAK